MNEITMSGIKELRYYVMLALYFPILLYAFSTFDLNDETFVVDSFEPVIVGSSQVVLGQEFQGRAFLAVGTGQGQELIGQDGLQSIGDSLFSMPTGNLLDPKESERVVDYRGSFRFQQVGGEVATIPVQGSFTVRRPDIVAMSEATQTLYRLCENSVRIEVPGLENRPLRLAVGNSRVDGRSIKVSPSGQRIDVNVFVLEGSDEIFLGRKEFAVIEPPRPEIRVTSAGRPVNNGDGISRRRALLVFSEPVSPRCALSGRTGDGVPEKGPQGE